MGFLQRLMRRFDENLEDWRLRQAACRELRRMPERQLLDLGIEPHMIDSFVNAILDAKAEHRSRASYPEPFDEPVPRQPIGQCC